ncbi:hypothetical protein BC940DRAFT_319575 [Gongronella butleri]|nr:hypothetical protein BC940DRAFT_319575 [Gongronella butleri]
MARMAELTSSMVNGCFPWRSLALISQQSHLTMSSLIAASRRLAWVKSWLYSWVRFYDANGLAQQINAKDTPEIWKVYENVKALSAIKDYDYEAKTQGLDEN